MYPCSLSLPNFGAGHFRASRIAHRSSIFSFFGSFYSLIRTFCFRAQQWLVVPGYGTVRIFVAVVLLFAAGLKAYQLSTEPTLETDLFDSRLFLMSVVEFELLLGTWLIVGLLPSLSWRVALICFGIFTSTSLSKAISGATSCGCFGPLAINPWYTAGLDASVVLSLLCWPPPRMHLPSSTGRIFPYIERPSRPRRSIGGVAAVWLLVGIPAAIAMGRYTNTTLSDLGEIVGKGDVVVLDPPKWLGKKYPLLGYIDIGAELKQGRWLVMLYHHDCPKCQLAIREPASYSCCQFSQASLSSD